MRKKLRLVLLILLLSALPISCSSITVKESVDGLVEKEPLAGETEKAVLSAWNVYWDHENIEEEIQAMEGQIDEICYFAAYFDSSDNLFIPDQVTNNFNRVKERFNNGEGYTHYLSIVNDKINSDGSSSLKDTDLLYTLFLDKDNFESHMNKVIIMAKEGGYDGVEIDYEGMKNDKELWALFVDYCQKLYERLNAHNLKMRVVLEPSLPKDGLKFPIGPSYIMMCYNLYGLGTGPGPKADQVFIKELVEKMEYLPGKQGFAFATGGFDWAENGEVIAITEQEARQQMNTYEVVPTRDKKSGCLYYCYTDLNQLDHEVWFADGISLGFWLETVKEIGDYNIALWRLNGNNEESLKEFANRMEE